MHITQQWAFSCTGLVRSLVPVACLYRKYEYETWGNWKFLTPQNRHPQPITKNLSQVISSATLRLCQIWCKSVHGGGACGQMGRIYRIFIYDLFRELTNARKIKTFILSKNPIKSCRTIKTTKYFAWVIQICLKQTNLADGRHIEKP